MEEGELGQVFVPHFILEQTGQLPRINEELRFAVGEPGGLTSNSWKVWNRGADVYIACRDNFREVKVSLHASGRWRMAFTEEAVTKKPSLVESENQRAWEVWDRPNPDAPAMIAFQLIFKTSELAVTPEHRKANIWRKVSFIEPAPSGFATISAVFFTVGQVEVRSCDARSFTLGQLDIGNGYWAQVVIYQRPEASLDELLAKFRQRAIATCKDRRIEVPPSSFAYIYGQGEDGHRFVIPARMYPD